MFGAGQTLTALLEVGSFTATEVTAASANVTGYPPCDALIKAGLGNRLLYAADSGYETRIQSWWALNSRLHPWCLVQPQNAKEVSVALTTLLRAGEGAGDWHIAVRGGGHSLGIANNIDDGVTIDLGGLNKTTYNKQTNIASVSPGSKWKDVYAELKKHGVLVTGGRDGDVGVGGFLLGGGSTYYMGKQGFACDTIKNFEVVLTNGTIVNANKTQNSDLWRALKGGGSNFGIVTRYDLEALEDKNIAYSLRTMNITYSPKMVDAVVDFTDHWQDFPTDALVAFLSHNGSSKVPDVMLTIQVNTQGDLNSTGFKQLNQIPTYNATVATPQVESLADAAANSEIASGTWNAQGTLTFKNDKKILHRAIKLHKEWVRDMTRQIGPHSFVTMIFFQPLPSFLANISSQSGGNMFAHTLKDHNYILWTSGVFVNTNQHDLAVAQSGMNAMNAKLNSFAKSVGGHNSLVYLNYADHSQDPLGSYGKKSVEYIRRVAQKYDPKGAFQTRVPGGFKIARVGA